LGRCKVCHLLTLVGLADASSYHLCAGKYQLQVFPEAGHFVQEDQPTKTAQVLVDFYRRNDRSALVLPPKVADMQAAAAMKKGAGAADKNSQLKIDYGFHFAP
jgi:hypothetical protein